jgi:beta-lactamase superfamily II metal-dependent hydrolase
MASFLISTQLIDPGGLRSTEKMGIFRLTMNPASEGDALLLTWGEENDLHHALVDLGRTRDDKALRPKLREIGRLELFAISHIDADHIEGAMPMLKETTAPFVPADVWFNAWHHLRNAQERIAQSDDLETLGAKQGEKLSNGILRFHWPWNHAFGPDGIVSCDSLAARATIPLAGLAITLLSPGDRELAALEPVWMQELAKANLRPLDPDEAPAAPPSGLEVLSTLNVEMLARKPFVEDTSEPNGASIAFLAEFGTRRVLMGADAHPGVIERSLRSLGFSEQNRLRIDLFKLCHHGSKANTSPSLLKLLDCTRFAISTDGSKHQHLDPETIARILVNDPLRKKSFFFNTYQDRATIWKRPDLQAKYNYDCIIPSVAAPGLTIDV